ncbi:MAG: glycosyltransferase [Erysipelotrichaceae bacterium]
MSDGTKEKIKDKLLHTNPDRRLLSHVPDPKHIRSGVERRGESKGAKGTRYQVHYRVTIHYKDAMHAKQVLHVEGVDVSATGMLLLVNEQQKEQLQQATAITLRFRILPGSMPEGMEMRVKVGASCVREFSEAGQWYVGVEFKQDLYAKVKQSKDAFLLVIACFLLACISFFIVLMRVESFLYFKFNRWLYLYSILTAVFLLTRYIFATWYRQAPIDPNYTPGVTIVVPCFNEETWIHQTIISAVNQDYPIDKLEVIIVDDCSSDQSVEEIKKTIARLQQEDGYDIATRVSYIAMEENHGKREALAQGVVEAKHELVVFVDSDSFLDPLAIRYLVQPFKDPKMGGVSGRTDVANTYTNTLTKMQSVRYYIAFRVMKAAEAYFDTVSCLSGPLACYKKEILLDNMNAWLEQTFFGQRATFGDDRSMTNFILAHHRTQYQDAAICSTIVPNDYRMFLKQQMRWKRSWLRESLIASRFMWKKEPFAAVSFYIGLLVPILAPIVVGYNLIYVPLTQGVFPTTFLVGVFLMAMLMSAAQLLLRRSTTWLFGLAFVIYYEVVLLWQMPVAWVTFWKSTWGTRMTPHDVADQVKKAERAQRRANRKQGIKQEHTQDGGQG